MNEGYESLWIVEVFMLSYFNNRSAIDLEHGSPCIMHFRNQSRMVFYFPDVADRLIPGRLIAGHLHAGSNA